MKRNHYKEYKNGGSIHVVQVNVSVGNWIPGNCLKHGQKPFLFTFFFFLT